MLVWVLVDNFSMIGEWGADSWLELPLIGTFQPSELKNRPGHDIGADL